MSWHGSAEIACTEYFDRDLNLPAVKLLPGEYHVADREIVQVTVLGSCVAACIRDNLFGIGGMNHFMLPEAGGDPAERNGNSARYGVYAMEVLINGILTRGGRRANLEAKLFGGGNVMRALSVSSVGERNAEFALRFLETEGIPVLATDLVDVFPRKVYHFAASGRVRVKKLRNLHNRTIFERERDYGRRLMDSDLGGEVELFG